MSLFKALMLCLAMTMTVATSAQPEMTTAPQGGITDIVQMGRGVIVVTIDRSLLPTEIRHEAAKLTLIDSQDNEYVYVCEGSAITISIAHLARGTCKAHVHILNGEGLDESHLFIR